MVNIIVDQMPASIYPKNDYLDALVILYLLHPNAQQISTIHTIYAFVK
jgi:hypothetical protein